MVLETLTYSPFKHLTQRLARDVFIEFYESVSVRNRLAACEQTAMRSGHFSHANALNDPRKNVSYLSYYSLYL